MENNILLPPNSQDGTANTLGGIQQLTIIGANGVGKTRFLNYIVKHNHRPSMMLSALTAFISDVASGGEIETLYVERIPSKLRDEKLSQLEKLLQMLFHDEFTALLEAKEKKLLGKAAKELPLTRLDRLTRLWHEIFPNNQIINEAGRMLFATEHGENLITSSKLSSGEKTVLYYIAAVLYARPHSLICVDNPSMFLHPAILNPLWNAIEGLRPDCVFVYNTSDLEFVNSRTDNVCIWVKGSNVREETWNYSVLTRDTLPEELFLLLMGSRRPVLFIEGDTVHSIDARLYPLLFREYTVRPLGSCNKVIEATRTFNDLKNTHKLDSRGLVDRDRRNEGEVAYLRRKNILVPEVAEVENMFLVEDVIRIMAKHRKKRPDMVFNKVRTAVLKMFASHYKEQALQHVRHNMKRTLDVRGDVRVKSIDELEKHLACLPKLLDVRHQYITLLARFKELSAEKDYAGVLKVFNHKPMLPESRIASLLGYKNTDAYIQGVLTLLKDSSELAIRLRKAMLSVFLVD